MAILLPAGGVSARYLAAGGVRSKLDEDMGGKPLLQRTVEAFTKFDDDDVTIDTIIVGGPFDHASFQDFSDHHADRLGLLNARLVKGGKSHRWETVVAMLAHVPDHCTHVAIHDAARPCVSAELLRRVVRAARRHPAVVPALACRDTAKRVRDTGERAGGHDPVEAILGQSSAAKAPLREVVQTLDREGLVLVQTPQVFDVGLLRRAYDAFIGAGAADAITDDAGVVERLGQRVVVVEGEARNIKVTLPEDVTLARLLLGVKEPEGRAAHKRF